jgi:hypothetical protein
MSALQLAAHQLCRAPEAVVMTGKPDLIKEYTSLLELARYLAYSKFWDDAEAFQSALASVILSFCDTSFDDSEQEVAKELLGSNAWGTSTAS